MIKSPLLVMAVSLVGCCSGCSTYPLLSDEVSKASEIKLSALTLGFSPKSKSCLWGLVANECSPSAYSPVKTLVERNNDSSPFIEGLVAKRGKTKARLRLRRNRVEILYKF